MNAILVVAGILVVTISMVTEAARSCDSLSWKSDKEFNGLETLKKYSHKMILHRTLAPDVACSVLSYGQLSSRVLVTSSIPNTCTYFQFEEFSAGNGVYGKTNLKNGHYEERRVFAYSDDNENFYAIFYTCNGEKFEAIDTYVTTRKIIPEAEKKIKEMDADLDDDQKWNFCKSLNEYSSY